MCIHAAECARRLHTVFDRDRRPWILADNASPQELATVIERCPSGALQYRHLNGSADEQPASTTTVTPIENGPLLLRGELLVRREGADDEILPRAALCRCGDSKNKPFCDNSHVHSGFQAPGTPLVDLLTAHVRPVRSL
jgi:CDGSH-type Zn-finger protein